MNDASRYREVDRLFEAVLDRPPGERTAFLDEACAGDPALRREVERLLAADAREAVFLDRPADEAREQRLGPYRLLRAIGRGGMGTVFLAMRDDDQYERLVAVKILRSGLEDTELRHRFLAERQILARLEHPNIARLYDGGSTEDGRPFLVMELIEGAPVDEYCDDHQLNVDRRLALFLRVCSAVQSAHRHLLVHRDIKPANILVTAQGEPKLLDFGIAKQLEPAAEADALTRTGLRVMTPSYASPEQVNGGDITTASDVYSLGVLLYELLAGRSPYQVEEGAPPYELERAINEQEPEKPSAALLRSGEPPAEEIAAARDSRPAALQRRLEGDLDTIVLTALRKEPARRYESVARLAEDLERHLRDLPVTARPDTLRYRTSKFVRRHRAAVMAAAAVVLLVAALVVGLFVQGRQTARERDKARYALSFLVDTFKGADPFHTRGERLTAAEVLDQGARRVSRDLRGQPDVQAALMDAIGQVELGLGRLDKAAPLLERALTLRRRQAGADPFGTVQSLEHMAALKKDQSDYAAAQAILQEALAAKRRLLGSGDPEVAKTLNQLGETLALAGSLQQAEALHQEALSIARQAEGPQGLTVAESLLALASRARLRGDYPQAEVYHRQGFAILSRVWGEDDPRLAEEQAVLAEILIDHGKLREAEALLRRALAVQRKALGEEHPHVSRLFGSLATTRGQLGDHRGAEVLYRQALAGLLRTYGEQNKQTADVIASLGASLKYQGRYEEAAALLERSLAVRRRILGDRHPEVGHSLLHLAECRRKLGQPEAALALARQSLSTLETTLGREHPYVAYPLELIGLVLRDQGQTVAAEHHFRRALGILSKSVPASHPQIASAKVELAGCLMTLERPDEALRLLREAEPILAATQGPDSPKVRKVREQLALLERAGSGSAGAGSSGPRGTD